MTEPLKCSFDHCDKSQISRGYCTGHYQQFVSGKPMRPLRARNKGIECSFEGCVREAHAKGLCNNHARQLAANGTMKPLRRFSGAGWHQNEAGYIIRKSRNAEGKLVTIYQHREMMEEYLGRTLLPTEEIHHKNTFRSDNRIDNFEIWLAGKQPRGGRAKDLLEWANQIIALYGPDQEKL